LFYGLGSLRIFLVFLNDAYLKRGVITLLSS
jgi:hypothetical protein